MNKASRPILMLSFSGVLDDFNYFLVDNFLFFSSFNSFVISLFRYPKHLIQKLYFSFFFFFCISFAKCLGNNFFDSTLPVTFSNYSPFIYFFRELMISLR